MSSLFTREVAPLDTPYDWNYTIVPQKSMHGRTFHTRAEDFWEAQAALVSGCSAMLVGIY